MKTYPAEHISISIQCTPEEAYEYAGNGANLSEWASGLSDVLVEKSGDSWVTNSPMGKVTIKFAPKNSFGVIDHDVTLPNGKTFPNPMRVLKNHQGCEVVFTLYRQPLMTDKEYDGDAAAITKDLETLKSILEG